MWRGPSQMLGSDNSEHVNKSIAVSPEMPAQMVRAVNGSICSSRLHDQMGKGGGSVTKGAAACPTNCLRDQQIPAPPEVLESLISSSMEMLHAISTYAHYSLLLHSYPKPSR